MNLPLLLSVDGVKTIKCDITVSACVQLLLFRSLTGGVVCYAGYLDAACCAGLH